MVDDGGAVEIDIDPLVLEVVIGREIIAQGVAGAFQGDGYGDSPALGFDQGFEEGEDRVGGLVLLVGYEVLGDVDGLFGLISERGPG